MVSPDESPDDDENSTGEAAVDDAFGEVSEMSDYERVRLERIEEIKMEAMASGILRGIEIDKQALAVVGKKTGGGGTGGKKRKVQVDKENPEEVRRSTRPRKKIRYDDESEEEADPRARARASQPSGSSRTLRPKPETLPVYYEAPELPKDGFIECMVCGKSDFNGCEVHPPHISGDGKEFKLEIRRSGVCGSKDSGEGVFNGEVRDIPQGVLFGPYTGNLTPEAQYKPIIASKQESGYAWLIKDSELKKNYGYVDPSPNLEPVDGTKHIWAKVNSPSYKGFENLEAIQIHGKIYYRTLRVIEKREELKIWYGVDYAMELGMKKETLAEYKKKEDHTEKCVRCQYCKVGMPEDKLEQHLEKVNGKFKC